MNKKTAALKQIVLKTIREIFFKILEYAVVCLIFFVVFFGFPLCYNLVATNIKSSYILKNSYVTKTNQGELFLFLATKSKAVEIQQVEIFDENMNIHQRLDKSSLYQNLFKNAIILKIQNCPNFKVYKIKITFEKKEYFLSMKTNELGLSITEIKTLGGNDP